MNPLTHVARKAASSPNTSSGKPKLVSNPPVKRAKKARRKAVGVIGSGKHASPYAAASGHNSGPYSGKHRSGY